MVIFVGFLVQQRQDAKNMQASRCAFLPSFNSYKYWQFYSHDSVMQTRADNVSVLNNMVLPLNTKITAIPKLCQQFTTVPISINYDRNW
jgi:hypothetical protein